MGRIKVENQEFVCTFFFPTLPTFSDFFFDGGTHPALGTRFFHIFMFYRVVSHPGNPILPHFFVLSGCFLPREPDFTAFFCFIGLFFTRETRFYRIFLFYPVVFHLWNPIISHFSALSGILASTNLANEPFRRLQTIFCAKWQNFYSGLSGLCELLKQFLLRNLKFAISLIG